MQSQDKKVLVIKKKEDTQNKIEQQKTAGNTQKMRIQDDFLKEVHNKKCKIWVYANEIWEYTGIVQNGVWNIKITIPETGEILFFNKAYLIGVKPLAEEGKKV